MKHVLIVDTGKEWGGGTQSLLNLIGKLDRNRFALTAAFCHDYRRGEGPSIGTVLAQQGVAFRLLPRMSARRGKWVKEFLRLALFFRRSWRQAAVAAVDHRLRVLPEAQVLTGIIAELAPDIVYGNNQPSSNLSVMLAAEAAKVPMVLHCRKAVPLSPRERAAVNRILSLMICVSPSLREHYLAEGIDPSLCRVISNGIDTSLHAERDCAEVRRSLGIEPNAFLVGTVGSLLALKRVDILLDACAIAGAQLPDLRCVVVGTGPMEHDWRARAKRLGIADRVVFAGFRGDAFDCIAAFDLFVLSSRQEGMPRVLLEAMLARKPVAATDVVGTRDLVRDGETGYLVPLNRADLLAERIVFLASNPGLRQAFGAAAHQWVCDSFSLESHAAAVQAALDEVPEGTTP